jgi:hypothetical protein
MKYLLTIKLILPQWIEAVVVAAFHSSSCDQNGHLKNNSFFYYFSKYIFIGQIIPTAKRTIQRKKNVFKV